VFRIRDHYLVTDLDPDPKLLISTVLRIRIPILNIIIKNFWSESGSWIQIYPSVNKRWWKKLSMLVNIKTRMGWNLQLFKFLSIAGVIMMKLLTFQYIFKRPLIVWCEKGEDLDPDPEIIITDPDPWEQIISDPSRSRSGTLVTTVPWSWRSNLPPKSCELPYILQRLERNGLEWRAETEQEGISQFL